MVNLKRCVEPTNVTFDWIVQHLDGKDKKWSKSRKHHKITKIESHLVEGVGFFSNVFRIIVHFSGPGHPFTAFLKVPTIERFRGPNDHTHLGDQMSKALVFYHNQEIRFYQLIGTRYTGFAIPKLFGFEHSDSFTGHHGRLLVSDVGYNACTADPHGLSIAQCCAAIEAIAKFHAFSRYTSNANWVFNSLNQTWPLDLSDDQIQLSRRLIALHEDYFVRNMQALRQLLNEAHLQVESPHLGFGVKPVLAHGDFWFNNILFKQDDKGRPSDRVYSVLDWQNCHIGTGISDLCRFILTSTSAQVQQMCTDRFIKLYFEMFQRELKKHGQEAGFCLEKLRQMYWFHYDHELIFALSYLANEAIKTKDMYQREKFIQRMIAGFEPIRTKYQMQFIVRIQMKVNPNEYQCLNDLKT